MTAVEHAPELVGEGLVRLTRALGEPARDLVILAEGNTSELLDDGRIALKASGSRMRDATAEDFVIAEVEPLTKLLTSPTSTQDDLTAALDAGVVDGRRRRGSIEALVHVAVQAVAPATFVGHTHPTAVVGLLASVHAEEAFTHAAYSDEAVVIGTPLYVPYAQPGIALGKLFHERLREHVDRVGELPAMVMLANHGIVAIAPTAEGIETLSEMAVKAAQVRTLAYACGGLAPVPAESTTSYTDRPDIKERRANINSGTM
ncbi:class II aldolase/adducin family protein [Pseudonocardia sp. TRM90224]|uniref:class II aldolase/adducin family protein n=1 Tax=Pseudonocardia sp. TRM90224 TaxID=2812678 RepID=UPI001E37CAEC|nr:class II aldolase/adducin family protein [Pseudonocardia sp. TRM90224]